MKIIIDAMGGDNAPLAMLQGAAQAVREYGVEVIAVGHREKIEAAVLEGNIPMQGIVVEHAPDLIDMDEDATDVLKKKPGSSVSVACRLLAEGRGDALVSAGSTGALLVGATLLVKRIRGIKRAALATIMPGAAKPWLLLDCGANVECRPEMLVQFAMMGSAYMEKVMGVERPVVGLVNNGSEETKGTELQLRAYPLLQDSGLNFMGNIEARYIPMGKADVVVADGFTGNIVLKLMEGAARMFSGKVKELFYTNTITKLAGLMTRSALTRFKKSFDYSEYGGAPLLGIAKPVIKAHGSSNARAVKNAIRQAKLCVEKDVCGAVAVWVAQYKKTHKTQSAPEGEE